VVIIAAHIGKLEKVMHSFPRDMQSLFPALASTVLTKRRDQPHGTSFFKFEQKPCRQLAEKLDKYAGRKDVDRARIASRRRAVAYEVAKRLRAPLDVFIVRKARCSWF